MGVPLDSWSREARGLDFGKVEGLIVRSGLDSVRRGTTRPTSPRSAMGPASPLASLRARRSFHGIQKRSRGIPRSGLDSAEGGTTGSPPPGFVVEPISFRALRPLRGRERKFRRPSRSPMLSLDRCRWV
jgi:hypothetical protein